jgi:hypothetical protein
MGDYYGACWFIMAKSQSAGTKKSCARAETSSNELQCYLQVLEAIINVPNVIMEVMLLQLL